MNGRDTTFDAAANQTGLQYLVPLLDCALEALRASDTELAIAFQNASSPAAYSAQNKGLAYWVFENNLVLEIFKAWLPKTTVHWEVKYPLTKEKADLVLGRPEEPVAIIEAKWWWNNFAKTLNALSEDVDKLRSWSGASSHRILLTFWASTNNAQQWTRDLGQVREFCESTPGVQPVYAGRFPTDLASSRGTVGAYFAVCALFVEPHQDGGEGIPPR